MVKRPFRSVRTVRFTPPTTDLLHVTPSDRGRPIRDLATRFQGGNLARDVETVTRTRIPLERTVRSEDGRSFIERLLPYRIGQDRIEGVVVTFIDVTTMRNAEQALQSAVRNVDAQIESDETNGAKWLEHLRSFGDK